jgi:phosphatidylinositol 3-kinase
LANYFNWYVLVECQEDKDLEAKAKYEAIRLKFLEDLKNSNKLKWRKRYSMLQQQEELVDQLSAIMNTILNSKDDRIKRMERLQSMLQNDKSLVNFKQTIRLPVDPHIQVRPSLSIVITS